MSIAELDRFILRLERLHVELTREYICLPGSYLFIFLTNLLLRFFAVYSYALPAQQECLGNMRASSVCSEQPNLNLSIFQGAYKHTFKP
jgi:hypothetical protein